MFECVKLMLSDLLMMKLHAQNMLMLILCIYTKMGVVVVVVVDGSCEIMWTVAIIVVRSFH